jgi:hypothetical protein
VEPGPYGFGRVGRPFGSCKARLVRSGAPLASATVVRRRLAIFVAGLATLVAAGEASAQERELWPGVTFRQTIQPTPNGPVVIDVLTGPRPGGTTTLEPLLSNDALTGRETLTRLEQRLSPNATYAGVNGDLFNLHTGLPSGALIRQGQILSLPSNSRSTAAITSDGTLDVRRVIATGAWAGTGVAHPFLLNRVPDANGTALFTAAWGASTPTVPGSAAVVLFPFAGATPGIDELTAVQSVVVGAASVAIPLDGAVLLAQGTGAAQLQAEAAVGTAVKTRVDLQPAWPGIVSAIGGGPQIVRNGAPVFRAGEEFTSSQLGERAPRSAVGQLKDGRIILVAVDGRQPGWSVGMTNFELAQALVRLGAVTAMAFDGGGSTEMAFDGTILNRPSDGAERQISTALAFAYTGAYVRASLPVVSPNGDGDDDVEPLSYKLVHAATVTVTLTAPDGSAPVTQTLDQQPGTYPVAFPPTAGSSPPEGVWKLAVAASDDLGQQTGMAQTFTVDDTLGFLQTSVPRLFLPPGGRDLAISWKLTRQARVLVTVETKSGEVVRTLALRKYDAGDQSVVWNGLDRNKKRVKGGVYRAHVVAKSALGSVQILQTFTVRQIAGPPASS